MKVAFALIHPDLMPKRGHDLDIGLDVFTAEGGVLLPGPNKISVGFTVEVPAGWCATIHPRSGMASGEKTLDFEVFYQQAGKSKQSMNEGMKVKDFYNNGIAILAQTPPIDPGYKGAVHVIVVNCSDLAIKYDKHTRFGQLVFVPSAYVIPVAVGGILDTRGDKGFGSTGV